MRSFSHSSPKKDTGHNSQVVGVDESFEKNRRQDFIDNLIGERLAHDIFLCKYI